MSAFVDPSARIDTQELGAGSRVLAYVHVGRDATIGHNCVLHDHAVVVGTVMVEEGVNVGPGAVIGAEGGGEVRVHRFASIGANVTVLPGVVIGRRAMVEAGSVVRDSVPANAIVSGNPATIVAYVDGEHREAVSEPVTPSIAGPEITPTRVGEVTLHRLTYARDLRGSLTAAEFSDLPFAPQRLFTVFDVPSESVRGAHAHRVCSQFLVCLAGTVSCLVDDGSAREEIRLVDSRVGLHIPPMIWGTQWKYTRDAVLLVLASHPYDSQDYIREYEEFLEELQRAQ
jgi:UDP-2-acetamido-3-amino-2,3-dideoxy-glucuronate N-acetyltransferase